MAGRLYKTSQRLWSELGAWMEGLNAQRHWEKSPSVLQRVPRPRVSTTALASSTAPDRTSVPAWRATPGSTVKTVSLPAEWAWRCHAGLARRRSGELAGGVVPWCLHGLSKRTGNMDSPIESISRGLGCLWISMSGTNQVCLHLLRKILS